MESKCHNCNKAAFHGRWCSVDCNISYELSRCINCNLKLPDNHTSTTCSDTCKLEINKIIQSYFN